MVRWRAVLLIAVLVLAGCETPSANPTVVVRIMDQGEVDRAVAATMAAMPRVTSLPTFTPRPASTADSSTPARVAVAKESPPAPPTSIPARIEVASAAPGAPSAASAASKRSAATKPQPPQQIPAGWVKESVSCGPHFIRPAKWARIHEIEYRVAGNQGRVLVGCQKSRYGNPMTSKASAWSRATSLGWRVLTINDFASAQGPYYPYTFADLDIDLGGNRPAEMALAMVQVSPDTLVVIQAVATIVLREEFARDMAQLVASVGTK